MGFRTNYNFSRLSRLETSFRRGVREGLQRNAIELAGGVAGTSKAGIIQKEMFKQPKSGRTYNIRRRGGRFFVNYIASDASGNESSNVLTGRLERSVRGKVIGSNRLELSANTPYARLQEKGGVNSSGRKVAARNNLSRPVRNHRRNIINNIDSSIRSNLK